MPLARNPVEERNLEMAKNIRHQKKKYKKSSGLFSFCLIESTDITGLGGLAIFIVTVLKHFSKECRKNIQFQIDIPLTLSSLKIFA